MTLTPQRTVISFVAIAAILGGSALWVIHNEREKHPPPALLIPVKAVDPIGWNKVIARGKYRTFEALVSALGQGTAGPDCIAAFEALALDADRLQRVRQWTPRLDGPDRQRALLVLYAELMLADSDADILYDCADADIQSVFAGAARDPMNYGRSFSWGLSRPAMTCIYAYETTRDTRFLRLFADAFERTLPLRDSELGRIDEIRGHAMNNWGTDRYAGDGRYSAEITTATRVAYPVACFIQLVRDDPSLQAEFGSRADRFLPIICAIVDQYDSEFRTIPGTQQGYYVNVPRNATEALNHMAWAGPCLMTLGDLTGNQKYTNMGLGVAEYAKASMRLDEQGCLVWRYSPQPDDRDHEFREWTWKSRTTIDLPLVFAARGEVFSESDLQAIARTFLVNVDRSTPTDPGRWSAAIDAPFVDLDEFGYSASHFLALTGYIRLDGVQPRIRERIEELVATRPDLGGWLHRTHGLIAYAWRLRTPGFTHRMAGESLPFPMRSPRGIYQKEQPDDDSE